MSKAKYPELRSNPDAFRAFSNKRAVHKMEPREENFDLREQKRQYDQLSQGEWDDIMPQGYEDVRTLKEIRI
ncbi:hypothetical protein KCU61_g5671, partial [Aureobasidium melanogenum]